MVNLNYCTCNWCGSRVCCISEVCEPVKRFWFCVDAKLCTKAKFCLEIEFCAEEPHFFFGGGGGGGGRIISGGV